MNRDALRRKKTFEETTQVVYTKMVSLFLE